MRTSQSLSGKHRLKLRVFNKNELIFYKNNPKYTSKQQTFNH